MRSPSFSGPDDPRLVAVTEALEKHGSAAAAWGMQWASKQTNLVGR